MKRVLLNPATNGAAGPTDDGAPSGARAADNLCPAADPQGHSLRVRGNQNKKTAEAIRRSGEGRRSSRDLSAMMHWH
jgi:hypothetical protein